MNGRKVPKEGGSRGGGEERGTSHFFMPSTQPLHSTETRAGVIRVAESKGRRREEKILDTPRTP